MKHLSSGVWAINTQPLIIKVPGYVMDQCEIASRGCGHSACRGCATFSWCRGFQCAAIQQGPKRVWENNMIRVCSRTWSVCTGEQHDPYAPENNAIHVWGNNSTYVLVRSPWPMCVREQHHPCMWENSMAYVWEISMAHLCMRIALKSVRGMHHWCVWDSSLYLIAVLFLC